MQLQHFNQNHDPKTGRFTFSSNNTMRNKVDNYKRIIDRLSDEEYRLFSDGGTDKSIENEFIRAYAKYQPDHPDVSVFVSKYGNVTLASLDKDAWNIGWATDPKYRGTGVTQANIKEAIKLVRKYSNVPISAIIEQDNIASQRTAEKAGFKDAGLVSWDEEKKKKKYVYN